MQRTYKIKNISSVITFHFSVQEVYNFCAANVMHSFELESEDEDDVSGSDMFRVASREEAAKHFVSEFCEYEDVVDSVIICDVVNSGMNKEIVAYLPPIYKYGGYTWRVVTTEPFKNSQSGNKVTVTTITRSKSVRRR